MKKIISSLTVFLVSMTTVVSLVASAAFNSNKDPNGDGDLDLADGIYITQYLIGHHEPSDLSQLDVDDYFVSFVYTPSSSSASINVSLDINGGPKKTLVMVGEESYTYNNKYLSEIVNELLESLFHSQKTIFFFLHGFVFIVIK